MKQEKNWCLDILNLLGMRYMLLHQLESMFQKNKLLGLCKCLGKRIQLNTESMKLLLIKSTIQYLFLSIEWVLRLLLDT